MTSSPGPARQPPAEPGGAATVPAAASSPARSIPPRRPESSAARFDASPCPTPFWLPDGHTETIWGARLARCPHISFARERVDTDDGDFVDIDWAVPGHAAALLQEHASQGLGAGRLQALLPAGPARLSRKALVIFHGLEGCSGSHTCQALAHHFRARGWVVAVPHFRGCSQQPNRLLRAYHSGDTDEIAFLLRTVRERLPQARWHAAGVSLGGNALAKFLGEHADSGHGLHAAAAVSAPLDLTACGQRLGRGLLHRHVYTRLFLRTLKAKVLQKAQRFPGSIDAWRVAHARDLHEFDDAYTAPVHGFAGVADYWQRASALPWLGRIQTPTLLLNARNDPFVPEASLPGTHQASRQVLLHQPATGGHGAFVTGGFRGHLHWMPRRLERFFGAGH
ncbi:MAG: alpha/beta fold hydrolase [Pigmentiphaga sp.]|nr:alpha/beta fold hydrolase [Pigmentiphaga sp.]